MAVRERGEDVADKMKTYAKCIASQKKMQFWTFFRTKKMKNLNYFDPQSN